MLSGTRWDSEVYDVKANIDRTLTYEENQRNIRSQLGIQTRNRGVEELNQRVAEAQRARQTRQDTLRQTGRYQGEENLLIDRLFQALPPGKRTSASGRVYYERRANRSDRGRLV